MITRIYIDNFRCFSDFEIRPGRSNLLLGPNGSGKSSFIDLMGRLVVMVAEGREIDKLFDPTELTRWDSRDELVLEMGLSAEGQAFHYRAILIRDGQEMTLREEAVRTERHILFRYAKGNGYLYDARGKISNSLPLKGNRSIISDLGDPKLKPFLWAVRRIQTFKLVPDQMDPTSYSEAQALSTNGANFASWFRHLSQEYPLKMQDLFEELREAVDGFEGLALKAAGKQGRTRDLMVEFQEGSYELEFDAVSDGQRVLIVLHALLLELRHNPRSICFDGPESFVGLAEIQPWLQLLDDALGDESQLFLISHHPEVIDFLAPESPVLFSRSNGGPVSVSCASFDRESGLKASEQIVRGMLDVV